MISLMSIFDFFISQDFFRYAIYSAIILGVLAPVVGSVVVIRRLSFIANTLSHFSLAGVTMGVLIANVFQFELLNPTIWGVIFGILGTFLIEKLRNFYKNYKELSMPIILSLGVALSSLFLSLSTGVDSKFINSLLFGSIYAVGLSDFILILIMTALILIFGITSYKKIVTLCFDETFTRVAGINVKFLQMMITITLALVISFFLNLIGVLLISALMIVPISIGILIGKSYKNALVISIVFSEISVVLGFILSYYFDLPTGATIILLCIGFLFSIMLIKKFRIVYLNRK